MKLILCLICGEQEEASNPKAIARICAKCDNPEDSGVFVKLLNYKKVHKILKQKELRLTDNGELI